MTVQCPYCGEPTDAFVDPGGSSTQDFVEDCCVCCRPIHFVVAVDLEDGRVSISADRDG